MEDRRKDEQHLRDKYQSPPDVASRNADRSIRQEKRFWKKALHRLQRRNSKRLFDNRIDENCA